MRTPLRPLCCGILTLTLTTLAGAQDLSGLANLANAIDKNSDGYEKRLRQRVRDAKAAEAAAQGTFEKRNAAREYRRAFDALTAHLMANRKKKWDAEKSSTGKTPRWNPEDLRTAMNSGKGNGSLDPTDPDYDGSQDVRVLNQKYKSGASQKAVAYAWKKFEVGYDQGTRYSATWPDPREGQKDWSDASAANLKDSYLAWRVGSDQRKLALAWLRKQEQAAAQGDAIPTEAQIQAQLTAYLALQGASSAAIRSRAAGDWPAVLEAKRAAAQAAKAKAAAEEKAAAERRARAQRAAEQRRQREDYAEVLVKYRKPLQAAADRRAMTVITGDEAESRANLKRYRALLEAEAPFRKDPEFQKLVVDKFGPLKNGLAYVGFDDARWIEGELSGFERDMAKFSEDDLYREAAEEIRLRDEALRVEVRAEVAEAEAAVASKRKQLRNRAEGLGRMDTEEWPYKNAKKDYAAARETLAPLVEAAEKVAARARVLEEILAEQGKPKEWAGWGYQVASKYEVRKTLAERMEGDESYVTPAKRRTATYLAELAPIEGAARTKKADDARKARENAARLSELQRKVTWLKKTLETNKKWLADEKAKVDAAVAKSVESGVAPTESFANRTLKSAFASVPGTAKELALYEAAMANTSSFDEASVRRIHRTVDTELTRHRADFVHSEYDEFIRSRDASARSGAAETRKLALRDWEATGQMLRQRAQTERILLGDAQARAKKALEAQERAFADLLDREADARYVFWHKFEASDAALDPAARSRAEAELARQLELLREAQSSNFALLKQRSDTAMKSLIAAHQNVAYATSGLEIYQKEDAAMARPLELEAVNTVQRKIREAFDRALVDGEATARDEEQTIRGAVRVAREAARRARQQKQAKMVEQQQEARVAAYRKKQAEETAKALAEAQAAYDAKMAAWQKKKDAYEAARKRDAGAAEAVRQRLEAYRASRRVRDGEAASWEDYEAAVRALEAKVVDLEAAFADEAVEKRPLMPRVRSGLDRAGRLSQALHEAKATLAAATN